MPVDPQERAAIFRKLQKQLGRVAKKPEPQDVHHFRTNSRRVETLIDDLLCAPTHADQKLVKALRRLHKKAGKVRDLDVQMALLQNLKVPQDSRRKLQLLNAMAEEREEREKKLVKAFDPETVRELRKRLKRAAHEDKNLSALNPLQIAKQKFAEISHASAPLTEKRLHQFRITGKRARYMAELAGDDPDARHFVAELKHLQDVIGDWHDWLRLSGRAKKLFANEETSALLSVLRNISRAKFRLACEALNATLADLNGTSLRPAAVPGKKPSLSTGKSAVAA